MPAVRVIHENGTWRLHRSRRPREPLTCEQRAAIVELIPFARALMGEFLRARPQLRRHAVEIESHALEALCLAVQSYRPGGPSSLRAYVYRRLQGSFRDALRSPYGKPGSQRSKVRTFVGLEGFTLRPSANPVVETLEAEESAFVDQVERLLGSPTSAIVIGHAVYGHPFRYLGEEFGLPMHQARRIYQRAINTLRVAYGA